MKVKVGVILEVYILGCRFRLGAVSNILNISSIAMVGNGRAPECGLNLFAPQLGG